MITCGCSSLRSGSRIVHKCGRPISRQSVDQIVQQMAHLPEGERVMILAPIVRGRKGEFKKELEKLARSGFTRARIDGEIRQLDEEIKLDKRRNHTIEVVVDRLLDQAGRAESDWKIACSSRRSSQTDLCS